MIPWKYRNVIHPDQTDREIKSAVKFIDKMIVKLAKRGWTEEQQLELVNSHKPNRDYSPPI